MEEIWKDIKEFEGLYQVSTWGRVKSLWFNKERILRPSKLKIGYLHVVLCKNGEKFDKLVHRLVAETFILNPDNLPEVNHKNEIKTDNRVENLEWCDKKYNINYGTCNQRRSQQLKGIPLSEETKQKMSDAHNKKPVVCLKDNKIIKIYNAIRDVRNNGFYDGHVCACCQGKIKSHKGFNWMYLDDYEKIHGHIE